MKKIESASAAICAKRGLNNAMSVTNLNKTTMKNFDLTTIYHSGRPLSWSAISSFEWRAGDWYKRYVLKEEQVKSPELEFGSMVDTRIQNDPTFLPELVRYHILQHEMRATFDKIPLIGYADTYNPKIGIHGGLSDPKSKVFKGGKLRDYKTGRKPWDQKRADETGQLTMYLFMLYLQDRSIKPEDVELFIDWLPTHIEDGKITFIEPVIIRTFKTKRTMRDILEFGQRIKKTWAEMEDYCTRMQEVELKEW